MLWAQTALPQEWPQALERNTLTKPSNRRVAGLFHVNSIKFSRLYLRSDIFMTVIDAHLLSETLGFSR